MYKILVIMYRGNIDAKTMHSQDLSFDYKDDANKAYDILAEQMRSSDIIKEVIKLY
ncbi:hypothetical protein [Erwinia phage FBB1]|nr:hypothetical protein [Erwinia phage FBB1]